MLLIGKTGCRVHGVQLGSVTVISDSLWHPGLQHARLPCPSASPRISSDSCPSSQWCHPAISSSVIPFSSCLQSFPASGSFPKTWLFTSGGQHIGALASVLPVNSQGWSSLRLTYLISLLSKGLSGSSPALQFKGIMFLVLCFLYGPAVTTACDHWEDHSLD